MKIGQVTQLTSYSLAPGTSESLAALLPEMHTLAGWQALDMGNVTESWSHYGHSKAAAARTGSAAFESHAAAEQAFVLLDADEEADAVTLLAAARRHAERSAPRVLSARSAAAHGETLLPTAVDPTASAPSTGRQRFSRMATRTTTSGRTSMPLH